MTSQQSAYSSALSDIDAIVEAIQQLQAAINNTDETSSGSNASAAAASARSASASSKPTVPRSLLSSITTAATRAKLNTTKSFKNLYTNLTKLHGKIEKNYSNNVDDLLPAPLFQSPAHFLAQIQASSPESDDELAANQTSTHVSISSSSMLAASSLLSQASQALPQVPLYTPPLVAAQCRSRQSLYDSLMDESIIAHWRREGRFELVEALRQESRRDRAERKHDGDMVDGEPESDQERDREKKEKDETKLDASFKTLHMILRALKGRDMAPCLRWVIEQKSRVSNEIAEEERNAADAAAQQAAEAEAAATRDAQSRAAARSTTSPGSGRRRRRVIFSDEDDDDARMRRRRDDEDGDVRMEDDHPSSSAASSASTPDSVSATKAASSAKLSLLRSSHADLHSFEFDLHQLKFLSLLLESERNATNRRRRGTTRSGTKRKQPALDGTEPSPDPSPVNMDLDASTAPANAAHATSGVEEEEASALAADASSEESDDDDDAEDAELNRIARRGQSRSTSSSSPSSSAPAGATSSQTNGNEQSQQTQPTRPSSMMHHAALQYAQTYFPPFADTRMDDIRRLSGCLLFLGHLAPSPASPTPSHPYAKLFSRRGQSNLWRHARRKVKKIMLGMMGVPLEDPMRLCLLACDIAVPQLLKYQSVMKLNAEMVAASKGAIAKPEIELSDRFHFHSVFVCPVTKEQCSLGPPPSLIASAANDEAARSESSGASSLFHPAHSSILARALESYGESRSGLGGLGGSGNASIPSPTVQSLLDANPPVMLACGHCISYQAMDRIVKTLRLARRFKCPTCPREQSPNEVLILQM